MKHRRPYVGDGADGARRSAAIDRSEADGLDPGAARDRCIASAARWEEQAAEIDAWALRETARRSGLTVVGVGETPVHFHPIGPDAAALLPPAEPGTRGPRALCGLLVEDLAAEWTVRPWRVTCPDCRARLDSVDGR